MSRDTVWLYWQGPRPGYVDLCLRSVLSHHPEARVLDRAGFDVLWHSDRDIDIDRLALNHQSDFIRAYLLAHLRRALPRCRLHRDAQPHATARHGARTRLRWLPRAPGYMSCNFMAARADGAVIADHYRRVCERLRAGSPLEWLNLASTPMDRAIAAHGRNALLLPTALRDAGRLERKRTARCAEL